MTTMNNVPINIGEAADRVVLAFATPSETTAHLTPDQADALAAKLKAQARIIRERNAPVLPIKSYSPTLGSNY